MSDGIGARVLRKEDERHLNGSARFAGDIWLPDLWEAAFVRSPIAHGRIRSIGKPDNCSQQVFTAEDMTGVLPIRADSSLPTYKPSSFPVLATKKVRYVGECIAICIAPTRDEAEDIAEKVALDLEELSPVIDAQTARLAAGPLVHEEWGDNLFLTTTIEADLDPVIRAAPLVIEREYKMARQCMSPLEGKAVLANWDKRAGQLVVYTSTQVPHLIRTGLSDVLQMDQSQIRVIAPDVGGGFGYKCVLQPEEVSVAWLARHLGRPVRWVEDRREHLTAGANTRQHHYTIKAYADKTGRLLALDAQITVDIGAYSVWPFTACLEAAQAGGNLPGPYVLPAYRCTTYSVATNKPPFTPYRGVARPGVCFAMELTIDAIARAAGRDPADVRRENLVPSQAMPYTNVTRKHFDSGNYPESVTRAAELISIGKVRARQKRGEEDGRLLGAGFSTFTEQSAHGTAVFAAWGLPLVPGYEQAMVKLTPSGIIELRSGNQSFGQGLETTIAQVACEWLKVPIDQVQVFMGDTGTTPYSTGAYASRGMVMAGGAVSKACETLAARIKKLAAHLLQTIPEGIELRGGAAYCGEASVTYKQIAQAWYLRPDQLPADVDTNGLEVTEGYKPDVDTGVFTYATHAAVVLVDPRTGKVEIVDYAIFEDCGRRVNPLILDGQAYGGAAQGIGTALFEEVLYNDAGQPLTTTLSDYILPGPAELISIKLGHSETPSPYTRHGIKGVGEGAAIAPAGAIVNAINDALQVLGVEINEVPATPKRILEAILAKKAKAEGVA
jgi:aerobic carbon-monoxide dehydrogenase large subunit